MQRSLLANPFATIPILDDLAESFAVAAKSFTILVAFACSSSLLLAIVAFTIVAFAHCGRRSNPSNILAPSHTDTWASFCWFSSHNPSTSTHTDCSPSLHRFKPQRPFGFHFNWWPSAFPSNFFFFPNYLKYETPKIIFIYCFSFLVSELIKIPCFVANLWFLFWFKMLGSLGNPHFVQRKVKDCW